MWAGARLSQAATITIVNLNEAGAGFNDPAPAAPVGGNPGTTVGQQRLNVFQRATEMWGASISSSVPILVGAKFEALNCSANSATLGSAGTVSVHRDFLNAPVSGTWYPGALANALRGLDLNTSTNDIFAQFNANIGTPGCLESIGWYYGFDANPGNTISLLNTVLHELAHGLGFATFVNLATGSNFLGSNDVFMLNLEDHSTGKTYPNMTEAERIAASTDTGDLHWIGTNVVAHRGFLTSGTNGGHVEMYAPGTQAPGSSVSHFSTSLSPNELMEPFATASSGRALSIFLMKDLGWTITPQAPTVAGRHIFYNRSAWDGDSAAANTDDDNAVATNKVALLPGGTATFTNYVSYSRGLNGIMVDIAVLPGTPAAADFTFKVGNDNSPSGWSTAPAPASINLRPGAGAGRSDRTTIIWADNVITNQWLQVTVKATATTGLAADDVFYFGNAIGETGNSTGSAAVNGLDEARVRANPHTSSNPADIVDLFDINRDGFVNGLDEAKVRLFATTSSTMLQLIDLSVGSLLSAFSSEAGQLILRRSNVGELILEFQGPDGTQVEVTDDLDGSWEVLSEQNAFARQESPNRWRIYLDRSARFFRLVRQ